MENNSLKKDQFASQTYLDKFAKLLPKGSSVLDVGCGAGLPVDKFLVNNGFAVEGIDISQKQIELARKNVPGAFYEVKDMSQLTDFEYCVNGIVSLYAISHIPHEEHGELFKKFSSFMPKGGAVLVTMQAAGDNSEKNKEIIEQAGFKIVLNKIDTTGENSHQVILAKK